MVDPQLLEMIRDRFDQVDAKLDQARESFDTHAATDEKYWRMLDDQQAQLTFVKRLFIFLTTAASIVGTWLGVKH